MGKGIWRPTITQDKCYADNSSELPISTISNDTYKSYRRIYSDPRIDILLAE